MFKSTNFFEEMRRLDEYVSQLDEIEEVLPQRVLVRVDLQQVVL